MGWARPSFVPSSVRVGFNVGMYPEGASQWSVLGEFGRRRYAKDGVHL